MSPQQRPSPSQRRLGLQQHTSDSLAFRTVAGFFAQKTQTAEGRKRLHALEMMPQAAQADHYRTLTGWTLFLAANSPLRFPEIPSASMFERNPHMDPFERHELRTIAVYLAFLNRVVHDEALAFARGELAPDEALKALGERIANLFDRDGDWHTSISPQFARLIKTSIQKVQERDRKLASLIKRYGDMLNEQIVFERNHRKVLAVKQNFRGRIRGILQDYSASGHTVYLEPEETVEDQNRLAQLDAEIEEELWRVRCEVTEEILQFPAIPEVAVPAIARMDMMQALALTAKETVCAVVQPNGMAKLNLVQARHPLLDEHFAEYRRRDKDEAQKDHNKMVPFNLNLDRQLRGLIISGANTGGKTVTLKTTGLLAWMANSGLPVPADEGTHIPFYNHILADIGDHQSLSHNLSTYASHLANMKALLRLDEAAALILLDELGSGTDPKEGNALAQALIEDLTARDFHLLVTTHQQILCTLALNHPHLDNGSMVFDLKRLAPTYQFVQGLPGRSHALETAANAGIPAEVLQRAKDLIADDQLDIQAAIRQLQEQHKQLRKQQRKLRKEELRLHRRVQETREEGATLERERETFKEQSKLRLSKMVAKAERELRQVLQDIGSQKQRRTAIRQFTQKKEEAFSALGQPEKLANLNLPESSGRPVEEWQPGDRVFLETWLKEGRLVSVDRKKARVDCKGKILNVTTEALIHLLPTAEKPAPVKIDDNLESQNNDELSVECKLLGYTVDDALLTLDRQIDRALRDNIPFLRVIHGHGSGALKTAVRAFLSKHPIRETFDITPDKENDGVTEIRFT